jgi:DNA-directed RNA polymerase alpha subunit
MTEQAITATTPLSSLAEHAAANTDWWKESAPARNELELPGRVIAALGSAGIHTVAQLRAAGPHKLRKLDHIGKLGFQQIVDLLRALDRQSNGGGA